MAHAHTEVVKERSKSNHCSGGAGDRVGQEKHPDHRPTLIRLNRIKGQIDGVERMIGEQRYCVDILVQFKAVYSALRAIESSIFETHVRSCVRNAAKARSKPEMDRKIDELMGLIFK